MRPFSRSWGVATRSWPLHSGVLWFAWSNLCAVWVTQSRHACCLDHATHGHFPANVDAHVLCFFAPTDLQGRL